MFQPNTKRDSTLPTQCGHVTLFNAMGDAERVQSHEWVSTLLGLNVSQHHRTNITVTNNSQQPRATVCASGHGACSVTHSTLASTKPSTRGAKATGAALLLGVNQSGESIVQVLNKTTEHHP